MQTIELVSWDSFKEICITRKNLNCQYDENPERYVLYGPDSASILWAYRMPKSDPKSTEQTDFEENHKSAFNWVIGDRPYPFSTSDFDAAFDGIGGTAPKGQATPFDYQITESGLYLNGALGFGKNIVFGDWVEFLVYDKDGIVPEPYRPAYPNWPVIKTWVKKLYVPTTMQIDVKTPYAGNPPQGMYLRCVFHSVGTENDVEFYINYYLHRAI